MHSSNFVWRSVMALSAVILLSVTGCGSSDKTCSDACNTLFNCAAKLKVAPSDFLGSNYASVSSCIDRCTTGDCPKKQQLVNCGAAVQCNNLSQVQTDVSACFTSNGCSR